MRNFGCFSLLTKLPWYANQSQGDFKGEKKVVIELSWSRYFRRDADLLYTNEQRKAHLEIARRAQEALKRVREQHDYGTDKR
jgi:hypothetical protein